MTKKSISSGIAVMLLIMALVPLVASAMTWDAYVKTGNYGPLNFRATPSTESSRLASIPYGQKVVIIDDLDNGWMRVNYGGIDGYVMKRYLSYDQPGPKPTAKPSSPSTSRETIASIFNNFAQTYYSIQVRPSSPGGIVHLRWAPSKQAGIITDCHQGDVLEVLAQNNSWAQVRNPDTGVTGFMMRSFLTDLGQGAVLDAAGAGS